MSYTRKERKGLNQDRTNIIPWIDKLPRTPIIVFDITIHYCYEEGKEGAYYESKIKNVLAQDVTAITNSIEALKINWKIWILRIDWSEPKAVNVMEQVNDQCSNPNYFDSMSEIVGVSIRKKRTKQQIRKQIALRKAVNKSMRSEYDKQRKKDETIKQIIDLVKSITE